MCLVGRAISGTASYKSKVGLCNLDYRERSVFCCNIFLLPTLLYMMDKGKRCHLHGVAGKCQFVKTSLLALLLVTTTTNAK